MSYTVVDVVPDTDEWLAERRASVGASEVAAVMGLSPYNTALDVYKSKHGVDSFFDPERAYVGHAAEVLISGWIEKFRPELLPIKPAVMLRHDDHPWLHASLDRLVTVDGVEVPVQMKSAHFYGVKDWEDGTPILVQAQLQTELLVADKPFGFAAMFGGDMRCRLYRVERDEAFIKLMLEATKEFWEEHVLKSVPPAPSNVAEVAELWPDDATVLEAPEVALEWIEKRAFLLATAKEAKEEADQIQKAVGEFMLTEKADTLTYQGQKLLTYKKQKRASYTVAESEFMVMRTYKAKETK